MIYLDNAATSGKKPIEVIRAVNLSLKEYSANPGRSGHSASLKASDAVFKTREKLASFFGASGAENVVFTANCTHSLNLIIKGLLKKGDHVVASSLEHNSVIRPLVAVGADFEIAKVSLTDDNETVAEFKKKIRQDTKLVICTGASNVLGKALPIEKIGELCKEKNIPFAVDAAQSGGVLPIDLKKMNISYLAVAPHKGFYAPMGLGALICEKNIKNTLIEGGTGTNSLDPLQPEDLPERLESGTVNVPAIIGLSAGIDFLNKIGMEKLYRHEMGLCEYLYNELSALSNVTLYTPKPYLGGFTPVVSFNIKGIPSAGVAEFLSENGIAVRGGLHCAPIAHRHIGTLDVGTVRVSPAVFNNAVEIERLLRIIKKVKKM